MPRTDIRDLCDGGNMAARLMHDTREARRQFKQGDPAPAAARPSVAFQIVYSVAR